MGLGSTFSGFDDPFRGFSVWVAAFLSISASNLGGFPGLDGGFFVQRFFSTARVCSEFPALGEYSISAWCGISLSIFDEFYTREGKV